MKLLYIIHSLSNSAGMERILTLKANALSSLGYEVVVVTTDQCSKKNFYQLNPNIKQIDLQINFSSYYNKPITFRILDYLSKNIRFKKELKNVLNAETPDIVISLMSRSLKPLIKNRGLYKYKIIYEQHFNKNYRSHLSSTFIEKIIYNYREYKENIFLKKIDAFVTLTNEDKKSWKNLENIYVIPNFVNNDNYLSDLQSNKVISIGRLEFQKGYDQLIYIWPEVVKEFPDWKLEIWGDGPEKSSLLKLIEHYNLVNSVILKGKTENPLKELSNSSIFTMMSRFEGFPMVLLEAMSCGVPVISFKCPCGPSDIIENGINGYLCDLNDYSQYILNLKNIMRDLNHRKNLGIRAKITSKNYSQKIIINKWINLFNSIANEK